MTPAAAACAARVYRLATAGGDAPVVVLAHGFGGVRALRLDVGMQLADWRAALAFARTLPGIDPQRVVARGTSFAGGRVMTTARPTLVTGASAGIGAAFAEEGHDLILVALRAERLNELAARLTNQHGATCTVLTADLTDPSAPEELMASIRERGLTVDVLINNAGMSSSTAFAGTPWSDLAGEIQLMITAVTQLAHLVVPDMKARGHGRIVNLSSLAAFAPPGESLLYTGITTYVLGMSQALDMELKPHGVNVTALCPGFTHSEFHDVMGTRGAAAKLPSDLWQEADAVAREGWAAVKASRCAFPESSTR